MGYYSRHYSIVAGQYTLTSPRGGLIYQPMIWIQVVLLTSKETTTERGKKTAKTDKKTLDDLDNTLIDQHSVLLD
jgi:hypothetical protein